MTCNCSADWRVELLDLQTGVRTRYVTPLSMEFEEVLNEVGNASITLPVRTLPIREVWPHLVAVAITRIAGPGASPSNPKCEFIGVIVEVDANSGGTLSLGLSSIEYYLSKRLIRTDYVVNTPTSQTTIAATLATHTASPIVATAEDSVFTRERPDEYLAENDVVALDAIMDLTKIIDGPDWRTEHYAIPGGWRTRMVFADVIGNQTPRALNARRGLTSYSIKVDASEHRTLEVGRDADGWSYTDAADTESLYGLYEKGAQYSDVYDTTALEESVQGSLANNHHPIVTPEVTVADVVLASDYALGDLIELNMNHGALQYQGVARLVRKSWSISEDQPALCTFGFVPETDPADSVLAVPFSEFPDEGCC